MSTTIYNREQLKEIINKNNVVSYGQQYANVCKSKIDDNLLKEIISHTSNCRDNLNERIYWILNDLYNYDFKCINCGKQYVPKYYGLKSNYRNSEYCGNKCLTSSKQRLERSVESYKKKTGYSFPWENPEVVEKRKQNCIEKYGVEHHMLLDMVKDKLKNTCIERYGVENVMQNSEISSRTLDKGAKYLTLPSGKQIYYQGYEDVAIRKLLEELCEEEIITDRKQIPEIWYQFQGKKRRYYPDIWIPSKNLIVEVKSSWTYENNLEVNLLKRDVCIELGYGYQFWVCSDKQVLYEI